MTRFRTGTGFSIELEGCTLEHRGTHNGLPLYESLGGAVTAIAIVENPAIGGSAVADESERTLTGAVMIPDLKISRDRGPNGREECYWYFSADTIRELQQSFKGKVKAGH